MSRDSVSLCFTAARLLSGIALPHIMFKPDETIEIDETLVSKHKYKKGRKRQTMH